MMMLGFCDCCACVGEIPQDRAVASDTTQLKTFSLVFMT